MKRTNYYILIAILISTFAFGNSYSQGYAYYPVNPDDFKTEAETTIYPNPVVDEFFYVKSADVVKSVEVLNVIGQSLKKVYNELDKVEPVVSDEAFFRPQTVLYPYLLVVIIAMMLILKKEKENVFIQ